MRASSRTSSARAATLPATPTCPATPRSCATSRSARPRTRRRSKHRVILLPLSNRVRGGFVVRLTSPLATVAAICGLPLLEHAAFAETETFTVMRGGVNVGHLVADTEGSRTQIDFDYKNNGRGPTIAETVVTDELGRPRSWQITGATTFGSKVDERFEWSGNTARWTDPAGTGEATIGEPKIYVAEGASPWALGLYARVLLADPDRTVEALPSGTLTLEKGEVFEVAGSSSPSVTAYTLSGIDLTPSYMLLDDRGGLFAFMTP